MSAQSAHKKELPELIAEVRQALSAETNADLTNEGVSRFLVARSLDVNKAIAMINKWHVWYNKPFTEYNVAPEMKTKRPRDIDTLSTDDKEDLWGLHYACSNLGMDKQGRPIYWEKSGLVGQKWSTIKKLFTEDELYLRHLGHQNNMFNRFAHSSSKRNVHIDKQVIVMDLKGVPFTPDWHLMKNLKRVIDTDQDYYPETLGTILVINAPFFFTAIWAVVKPWLDPMVMEKVQIVGGSYADTLKHFIDEDQIPEEYGGSRKDFAWKLPESYQPEGEESGESSKSAESGEVNLSGLYCA